MKEKRILIVDDSRDWANWLKFQLEKEIEGYEFLVVYNPNKALEMAISQKFDLVLSDLNMPKMNGLELFQKVRQNKPELPFVIMSGMFIEITEAEILQMGVSAFVDKPLSSEQITSIVKTIQGIIG